MKVYYNLKKTNRIYELCTNKLRYELVSID